MKDWVIVMVAVSEQEIMKSSVYRHLLRERIPVRILPREKVRRPLKHDRKRWYLQRLIVLDDVIEPDKPNDAERGPCWNCKNRFKCAVERLACDDFNEYVVYGRLRVTADRLVPSRSFYMANFPHDPHNNRMEYDHKLVRRSQLKNKVYFNSSYVPVLAAGQGV